MRQTIEEVIAEFDKTFITDGGTNLGYRNPENIRHFLRTTLTSRDQQIREVIESKRKEVELDNDGEPYTAGIAYNCALDDILLTLKGTN